MTERKRTPDWFVGFLIAIVIAAIVWYYADELGIGDEPALEGSNVVSGVVAF